MKAVVAAVACLAVALGASAQVEPKKVQACPPQVVQIREQMDRLNKHAGPSPFLTIQEKGGQGIVQVARIEAGGKTNFSLNIAYYPSKEPPQRALGAAGIVLPVGWMQEQVEPGVSAQYSVPSADVARLPVFIYDLFTKFFKRPATFQLDFAIEANEPLPPLAEKPEIKFSLGHDKSVNATDSSEEGRLVSFDGIGSTLKQNGQLVEAHIGNMDDGMKTGYDIVLDRKGKQLAAELSVGPIHVTGHVTIKNGKEMLVVEEFSKKQAERVTPHDESPQIARKPACQPVERTDLPKITRPTVATTPEEPAGGTDWLAAKQVEGVDLAGSWQVKLPAGFVFTAGVSRVSAVQYQLKGARILNGTYELRGNELVVVSPVDARLTESIWKFKSPDSLVLVKSPSGAGSDYTGATLKRIE